MKTDAEGKGKRATDKTILNKKIRSSVSKTDGKQPEKKSRKPPDVYFSNIIEMINEGFVSFDAQMNYLYVNQRGSELLKRSPEELIGKNYWEVYPQDKDTAFGRAYVQALETQTPIALEDFYVPGQRWLEKRIYPTESGLSIFFNDITQRKQTEEILQRIDERLLATYQHAPVGIVECSLNGRYLNVNDEFCRMLGYDKEELLARGFQDITYAEDVTVDLDLHRQLATREIPFYKIEKRYVRKDGELIWAEVTRSAVHDPAGNVLYTIGVALDITARKQAEVEIRDISKLPAENPNPIMRLTPDGKVLYANATAQALLHYWQQETGRLLPIDLEQQVVEAYALGQKKQSEIEQEGRTYSCTLAPIREAGYVNFYGNEITERKRTEQALREKDEQLRRITEITPVLFSECSSDFRYLFVNRAAAQYLGFPQEEIIGQPIQQIMGEEAFEKILPYIQQTLKGERVEYEAEVSYRGAGPRFMHVIYVPKRDAAGTVTGWLATVTDITERKRAEAGLLESQERMRLASQAARACTWELNIKDQSYKLGDNFEEVLGFPPDLLPKNSNEVSDLLNVKEDMHAIREVVTQAVQTRSELPPLQYRVIHPLSGEIIWLEVNAKLVYDSEGKPERMFGMVQNITERKRSEQVLRQTEQQFRILSNTVPSLVWSTSPDGTIQYVNEHWQNYTGLSTEESMASWEQLVHPDDRERVMAAWNQALATAPDEYFMELRYRRYDGQYRWFQSHAVPTRDEHGNVTAWYGVTTDIHDRYQREAELQSVINNTPFMMTRCSRDLRYRFVSRTYAEMVHLKPEQVNGKPIAEIMGEQGLNTIRPYIDQVLQGQRVEYESEVPFEGVGTLALHVIYTPDYDQQGNVIGWFASIVDVTTRKAAELERTQLLEREQEQRARAEQAKAEAEQARAEAERELSERKLAEAALGLWAESPLPRDARPVWLQYGMALAATLTALLLRFVLEPALGDSLQFITLFGAIAFSVWYGGIGPALFSAILGFLGTSWLLMDWQHFLRPSVGSLTGIGIFLLSSGIVIALGDAMQRAQRHAHQSARVAVERKREAEFRLVEQKRVEEALRESERKFSLIYHHLPFAATLSRLEDAVLVDVNDTFQKIFGLTKEESVGKTALDLGILTDAEGYQGILAELQRQGSLHDLEIEFITRLEGPRLFLVNVDLVNIDAAQYLLTSAQDITERKRIQQELARERELLNRIFESIPVMLTIYEPSTSVLRLNAQFERLTGWTTGEVGGQSLMEACYPDPQYRERVLEFMNRSVQNEWMDIQMRTRDGRTLETSWSNIRLSNDMQVGIGIDISERKHMEQDLKRERELLERLFETMPVLVSMYYPETNSMRFNQEFERTLGWKSEEVTVTSLSEALYPDPAYRGDVLQRMAAAGRNDWVEVQVQTRQGRTLDSLWSNISIMDGERVVRGIALGIDITERKRAEQALREYARQQTALYGLADALQRARSQEQIYAAALGAILDALQCDRAAILLFGEDDKMHFVAWRGLADEYRRATEGHSPWQREEKNPEPICIVDIDNSDLSDNIKAVIKAEGIGSLAFIPLISDGELIGKFMVYFDSRHACSDAEIDLSQTIAHQLAAAIKRKRAEEALRASERLYRTIARSIPGGGVYVVDKDFRYLVAEGPVTEAFGLTREMLEGHTVAEAFPGERAERMEARLRESFAGETVSFETVHNGHVFWTQQAPIADSPGQVIIVTLDITERKQMEQALRQSEERFARFMQYLPGLAWIKDVDGRYVYANDAAEKAFGVPREQLYGKRDPEVFDSEVAAQFAKNDQQALTEGKGLQAIEMLPQGDGVVHHSLVTKFPILGSDGNALLIGGTAFDITDRVQMEVALREARERAERTANRVARLQQVTASLVGAATPARLAEQMLEQGTRATGASASILRELVGEGQMLKTIAALGYPPEAVRMEPTPLSATTPLSDAILTKQPIWIGSLTEFADKYPALAESRARLGYEAMVALPLTVGEQVLGGLSFSFVEKREFATEEREFFLTVAQQCAQGLERVRGAEALRQSEGRYRALVNQATAGIVRKDPNGKMLFVNEAFCEMLGYRPEELVGQMMWQFTHPEDVLENRRLFSRLMQEGTPFHLEKRLLHRDGSILWATVSVSPVLDADGKPESAVSVYADITERKQAEVDLNESRERFRNLFNLVPVAVYTCNADGLIQEFNRSAVELWGREPIRNDPSERYCGSLKIYHPDGRFMPHKSCPMARILRGETLDPSELEIVVERHDGSRRLVIAHPLAVRNEHGKIVGAINCLYDLTDRKQAESRLALLAHVSDLARIYEDPVELMSAVADAVGKHFQARRCLFNEINLEEGLEIVHHDYHNGIESVEGVHKISEYSNITTAEIMAGKTIVNHDSQTDPRTASDYERTYRRMGERAYVAVPLMREEEWAATLWISDDLPRQWSAEEVSLLQAVAERTWTAAEKLRIDAELRDSEERLRVTFNTTAVGFATLKPDLRFVEVNDAYCAITGYSREMLMEMDSYSLTHPAYLEDTSRQIAQLVAGEVSSSTLEKIYIRRDGTQIWVQNSISLVRDAEGAPLHLIVICQDVTERKQAEEALQRLNRDLEQLNLELEQRVMMRTAELSATNEHLLEEIEERAMVEEALRESDATTRLILDTSPDAIVITNRAGRIMRVNAQIEPLFGYKPQEVLGEKIELLIPERFHQQHLEHRADYNQRPHRRPMGVGLELFGRRRDGTEFSVDVTLTPILNQNIADWDTMVTIRDSTERKRMEAELRESHKRLQVLSQRLVEVQEEERRAIARELHDRVGQSLAALNLNLTIVNNELSSMVDEQVSLRLSDSMQLVAEVIALVRDVMADLRPAVLDDYGLEAALHTTLERFKSRFGINVQFEKNQSLIPRLGPSMEMTLLRIAQEAIANAGRHAQADQITLSLQLDQNVIRLMVRDNGTGIQSWEQANRPGSHGLTIMRERAEAVGGQLAISSTPGQGTKIEVSIPVQYQNPKE